MDLTLWYVAQVGSALASKVWVQYSFCCGFFFSLQVIDTEHGLGGDASLLGQLQACGVGSAFPVVRINGSDSRMILRVGGCPGSLVPFLEKWLRI